jgi:hypothetical protein
MRGRHLEWSITLRNGKLSGVLGLQSVYMIKV